MKAPSPAYVIGQVVAAPADIDRQALHNQRTIRAQMKRIDRLHARHPSVNAMMIVKAFRDDALHRAADPFEQARTFLRRKGFSPVAKVCGVHLVGRCRFDDEMAVMAFAKSKGWKA